MTPAAAPAHRQRRSAGGGAPDAAAALPFTGEGYMNSLRDDRCVYINGERVDDVTTHPAMRNSVRSIARMYDALHEDARLAASDPGRARELSCPGPGGGFTHPYFVPARSAGDLRAAQRAIAGWSRLSYGWMGRTPDYKASLTNTFGANAGFYGPFAENARRWHRYAVQRVPFMSHALVNPPIDRHLRPEEVRDICVRVERETDAGIVVSGAKVVATGAAVAQCNFVGQTPATASDDPEQALAFITPTGAPGVKLLCRNSYEAAARACSLPFDAPLSSRFDENDAILVFDEVFVPWEDVLIYRDCERVRSFFPRSGFLNGFLFHSCTRLAVKMDFLAGLLAKALRTTGGDQVRGKRALLGEVVAWSHTFWSLSNAMAADPEPWTGGEPGCVLPNKRAALAYCVLAPDAYPRVLEIIQKTVASALVYLPSSVRDLANPETAGYVNRFVRGSNGVLPTERVKVMKLLWDAVGSEFGGRHELYERSYAGGWECIRLMVAGEAEKGGRLSGMEALADQCLADYDEHGWTGDTWMNPEE